ncbi:hypothetical protein F6X40_10770 [Paraburkholderia sp. UCT31]|uniref:hypothetical protein n=1 Tax=Paraburkholderia sp. UCT31 TaxID=2615209 RepID=UPI0016562FF9|nr:hypothetical protein [Paraburkholderia sp. UCT31]MBC8737291.1 hypothetical protein [Paraburkholderia sp. UCT31]
MSEQLLTLTPEKLAELLAPFPLSQIEWRTSVNKNDPTQGLAVPCVKFGGLTERLDHVLGAQNWKNEFDQGPNETIRCKLAFRIGSDWLAKEHCSTVAQDAFVRAATMWGLGRYLHRVEPQSVELHDGRLKKTPSLDSSLVAPVAEAPCGHAGTATPDASPDAASGVAEASNQPGSSAVVVASKSDTGAPTGEMPTAPIPEGKPEVTSQPPAAPPVPAPNVAATAVSTAAVPEKEQTAKASPEPAASPAPVAAAAPALETAPASPVPADSPAPEASGAASETEMVSDMPAEFGAKEADMVKAVLAKAAKGASIAALVAYVGDKTKGRDLTDKSREYLKKKLESLAKK